ncbi:hypothetical protein ZOSMA_413G00050 [Zostera marina]|uniref:Uncharacterized protein n=1 Tax=Zostera marina TaxID=29655 RepID=A0A0K9P2Z5_ZOSMR|nr:hypothetical protein ZOSMA_413G00050 [Zostera marina]
MIMAKRNMNDIKDLGKIVVESEVRGSLNGKKRRRQSQPSTVGHAPSSVGLGPRFCRL